MCMFGSAPTTLYSLPSPPLLARSMLHDISSHRLEEASKRPIAYRVPSDCSRSMLIGLSGELGFPMMAYPDVTGTYLVAPLKTTCPADFSYHICLERAYRLVHILLAIPGSEYSLSQVVHYALHAAQIQYGASVPGRFMLASGGTILETCWKEADNWSVLDVCAEFLELIERTEGIDFPKDRQHRIWMAMGPKAVTLAIEAPGLPIFESALMLTLMVTTAVDKEIGARFLADIEKASFFCRLDLDMGVQAQRVFAFHNKTD
jgi:hypothetical protein